MGSGVSLLLLVMLGVVELESASGLVIVVLVNEERTEERLVLLKGKEDLDGEVEGWTGREVEAVVEVINFLTLFTPAVPVSEAFKLRLASRPVELDCAEVEQLWSWGKR